MTMAVTKGLCSSLLALTFALTLASCATDAPPPPPPPPPAPAGPPVALAPEISDAAAVYVDYIEMARSMRADFSNGTAVQSQLQAGASFEPSQLARGAVAYAAIVAMQEPSFRSTLRGYAANDAARAQMVQQLMSNPSYAAAIPGADIAARRVILALSSDGQSVYNSGAGVKRAAYDVQHQSWSKEMIADRDGRLIMAKQNSTQLRSVESGESAQLLTAALTGNGLVTHATTGQSTGDGYVIQGDGVSVTPTGTPAAAEAPIGGQSLASPAAGAPVLAVTATDSAQPAAALVPTAQTDFDRPDLFDKPYTPAVNRALTIAALAILGEGGSDRADTLVGLLDDNDGTKCLSMSKLNLYQCLAVAKPYYEDVFCLGQHVLMDTGQCVGKMSSNALSFEPVTHIGFNDDGSMAHATAEPYLKPIPVKTKKAAPAKKHRRR